MSFVSRLVNPNPPLTADEAQAAAEAAIAASDAPSPIESIHRGQVSVNRGAEVTVTISEVDLAKSWLNLTRNASSGFLASATQVRLQNNRSGDGGGSVFYEVIEFV